MSQRKEIYTCPAYKVLEANTSIMDDNLKVLQAGMKLACNEMSGNYYKIFTVGSVLAGCVDGNLNPNETVQDRLDRNRANGGRDQYIFGNATCLSNSPTEQETVTEIKIGDLVLMEGVVSEVVKASNDNLQLEPVENYEWVHPMDKAG